MAVIYLIFIIGRLLKGPGFQIEQNEALAIIVQNAQLPLRILVIFFATVVTPVFEELIFRVCCKAICVIWASALAGYFHCLGCFYGASSVDAFSSDIDFNFLYGLCL